MKTNCVAVLTAVTLAAGTLVPTRALATAGDVSTIPSKNGAWSPFYTTQSANIQVVALVNGATPSTASSLYQQVNPNPSP